MPNNGSQSYSLAQLYDMSNLSGSGVSEQDGNAYADFQRSIADPTLASYLGSNFSTLLAQDSEGNANYGPVDQAARDTALIQRYGTTDVQVAQDWRSQPGMFNTGVYVGDGAGKYALSKDNRWNENDTRGDLMAIASTLAGPLMGGMGSEVYNTGQAFSTAAGGATAAAGGAGVGSDLYSLGSGNLSGGQGLTYAPSATSGGSGLTYGVPSGGTGFYGTQAVQSASNGLGQMFSPTSSGSSSPQYGLRSPTQSGGQGLRYGSPSGGEGLMANTPTSTGYGLDSGLSTGLGGGGAVFEEPMARATASDFNPAQDSQAANTYDYVSNGLGDFTGGNLDFATSNYTTPAMDAGSVTPWWQDQLQKYAKQQIAKKASEKTDNPFLKMALGVAGGGGGTLGTILNGATGLYQSRQYAKDLKNNRNQLSGLFSPDSPYAQQMRQQLERRDAAAGRRSQYGNREVQLAANLAQNQSRLLPQINGMDQARRTIPVQQAAALGQMYQKLGGAAGIKDLYTQGTNTVNSFMDWLGS